MLDRIDNFIHGTLTGPKSQKYLKRLNPKSGELLYEYADSDLLDLVACVQAAHAIQKDWRATEFSSRREIISRFCEHLHLAQDSIAELFSQEMGCRLPSAREILKDVVQVLRLAARFEPRLEAGQGHFQKRAILRSPTGLCGLVLDQRGTLQDFCSHLAACILSANELIVVAPEGAGQSLIRILMLAQDSGLPHGACQILLGNLPALAEDLASHPAVKQFAFVGENELSQKLSGLSLETSKRTHLNLGVNNPVVIFGDVDLARVLPQLLPACFDFHRFGRERMSRVLVQEKFLPEFKEQFLKHLRENLGNIANTLTAYMPDRKTFEKFHSYRSQSEGDKAKFLFAEKAPEDAGSLVWPLVVDDLSNCSTLHQEDLQGPIVFIQSFKYPLDVLKALGNQNFAYNASVWTKDMTRALRLADQLEFGHIYINQFFSGREAIAHGGMKATGNRLSGFAGLMDFYSNIKLISIHYEF